MQRHEDRRVLVIFLPISSGQWKWVRPSSLESFEGNGGARGGDGSGGTCAPGGPGQAAGGLSRWRPGAL